MKDRHLTLGNDTNHNKSVKPAQYESLVEQIGDLLRQGRTRAAYTVNTILVQTYWQIGKYIVEFEQGGLDKSEYGSKLLDRLSFDLTTMYGKGFSRSNLFYIRSFYVKFSKIQTVFGQFNELLSHKLSRGHYIQILKADNELEIKFYTKQCEILNMQWITLIINYLQENINYIYLTRNY